eukprot:TRINITY_DN7202_c0_g1_i1.p1 TRINITY_DN7202_c0_g1~~TRINITY_DN7202_c0_g1_i1.p1  ORF type:complete len:537 (-),score=183.44 TRINITY_DN7202_c0_g1_i1:33-1616(-)
MNESIYKDIYGAIDKNQAQKIIDEMKDPHQDLIQNAKEIFPFLSVEKISEILKKNNYFMDNAINELEEHNVKYEEKKQAELFQEKNKLKEEKCRKELEDFAEIFNSIDPERIKEIYIANNFDLLKTSEELYELVKENEKQSEELLSNDINKRKENMLLNFLEVYKNLTRDEITQEIENNDMFFDKIDPILHQKSIKRYLHTLIAKFKNNLSKEEIEQQFKLANYNYENTITNCLLIINKKNKVEIKENNNVKNDVKPTILNKISIENSSAQHDKTDSFTFEYDSEMREKSKMIFVKFNENENHEKLEVKEKIRQSIKNHLQKINTLPTNNKNNFDKQINGSSTESSQDDKISISSEIKENKIHAKINFPESKYYCYIGFYVKGESYCIQFDYLYNLKNETFIVDKPSLNGDYEFRLHNKSSFLSFYGCCFISDPVTVDDKDILLFEKNDKNLLVKWEIHSFDPLKRDAYVALYLEEENRPKFYVDWNWVKSSGGSLSFRLPKVSGSYQAHVYIGNNRNISSSSGYII